MNKHLGILFLCTVGAVRCGVDLTSLGKGDGVQSAPTNTEESLTFTQDPNSPDTLRICQDDGSACVTVTNPDGCAALVIKLNPESGEILEQKCSDKEGLLKKLDEKNVNCTMVVTPDRQCMMCSHIDGPVVFERCSSQDDHSRLRCELKKELGHEHKVCFDADSQEIFNGGLERKCRDITCPPEEDIECAAGTLHRVPGECCPRCVAKQSCDKTTCAKELVVTAADCTEPGTRPVRSAEDCCSFKCERVSCDNVQCTEEVRTCAPGSHLEKHPPFCCGRCVPDKVHFCLEAADCGDAQSMMCFHPDGRCLPPEGIRGHHSGPGGKQLDSGATAGDPNACYGICKPLDFKGAAPKDGQCPLASAAPWTQCLGQVMTKRDRLGCEFPVCVCLDGHVSNTGKCENLCDRAQCAAPPVCDRAKEVFVPPVYPDCCGTCAPIVQRCSSINCAQGFDKVKGPEGCDICVPKTTACVDSDGGLTVATAGSITVTAGSRSETFADICTPDGKLVEMICPQEHREPFKKIVTCPSDTLCKDGACVAKVR